MKAIMMIVLFCLPGALLQKITYINALVNKAVTLPCEIECTDRTKWTTIHPYIDNISDCDKDACRITDRFQERFSLQTVRTRGTSLHINPVKYNDKGSYRCSCDGKVADVKLNAFDPMVVKANELKNISLPCYGDTRKDANDLQWKKDKQKVLLYVGKNRTITQGIGFKDRFNVSPEAFQDGDLSLLISSVQKTDAGLYRCTIHYESREGDPRAVLLEVEEQSRSRWLIAVVVLVCIGVLAAIIVSYKKNPDVSAPTSGAAQTDPPHSVQEESNEDTSSIKVSSTMPFLDS